MTWPDFEESPAFLGAGGRNENPNESSRIRLSRDLLSGRYPNGEILQLPTIAKEYDLDCNSTLRVFADLHALGMVTLSGTQTAIVKSVRPKEMHEAYEIRAALEEVGGRAAAKLLMGNTTELQRELNAMRTAVRDQDLDSYAEHDAKFHRHILQVSDNNVLVRVWDSLAFDIRIRAAIGKVTENLPAVVESHQPIIHALERGQGNEAGALLRNHVETFLQFLRKSEQDFVFFRGDLKIAKDVQRASFPQRPPSIPGLSSETFYKPAHSVGGDYYDFFPLPSGTWGIAIGDVSGKGIGAALVMASLQASLRAHALHTHSDLATLMSHVNRMVYEVSPVQFFASLFYAEYEPATRVLTYVNAGHNPPIVLRRKNGQSEALPLPANGAPIGAMEDSRYAPKTFQLEIGDVLIAYTDGITEAENTEGEPWGQRRMERLLCGCGLQTPTQIVQHILDERSAFSNNRSQADDMTLVVMEVQIQAAL